MALKSGNSPTLALPFPKRSRSKRARTSPLKLNRFIHDGYWSGAAKFWRFASSRTSRVSSSRSSSFTLSGITVTRFTSGAGGGEGSCCARIGPAASSSTQVASGAPRRGRECLDVSCGRGVMGSVAAPSGDTEDHRHRAAGRRGLVELETDDRLDRLVHLEIAGGTKQLDLAHPAGGIRPETELDAERGAADALVPAERLAELVRDLGVVPA